MSDESLSEFVQRRFGAELLDRLAQPLISGIYSADPTRLSAEAAIPHMVYLERAYGSVIKGLLSEKYRGKHQSGEMGPKRNHLGKKYGPLATFDKGMSVLIDEITSRLP